MAGSSNYSSLLDAIPQLSSLTTPPSGIPPYLGGRNFTYGCLQAVSESLRILNGNLVFTNASYFGVGTTIPQIQDAATYGTLCTTNGSAPRVLVPYSWCEINCWGWEASHWNSLQQWIGPLVQFILPCLAFCLSVPRNWKISFPEWILESKTEHSLAFFILTYLVKFPVAFLIVFWDTILWLSICFAIAGPMLLSAIYEYTWDGIILDFLQPRKDEAPRIPGVTKARLLLAAVVGNVKLEANTSQRISTLPGKNNTPPPPSEIWSQVMGIAEELIPARGPASGGNVSPDLKLKALMNAQSNFGGAVGAPVVFFIGSFVYNIIEAESRLGDNDTAHALAFGMWWMTISHLAVISSAVLASNNPSALQGLVGKSRAVGKTDATNRPHKRGTTKTNPKSKAQTSSWAKFISWMKSIDVLEHAFDSTFEPISLRKRGPNKKLWIDKTLEAYGEDRQDDSYMTYEELREAFRLGFRRRAIIWLVNLFILLGAPCALAFTTSFTTPVAGLGCRSLTHLVYYSTQVIQMALWSLNVDLSRSSQASWRLHICRGFQILFGALAVFAAIGGTLMQIMGVYRNCLCKMPTEFWLKKYDPKATVGMSYITPQSVPMAEVWKITGSLAAATLGLVSALAWWHQRRLRRKFIIITEKLLGSSTAETASPVHGTRTVKRRAQQKNT